MALAVAENASFTKASRQLQVAQSAISRKVKLLEEELGEPLFKRMNKKAYVTPAGSATSTDANFTCTPSSASAGITRPSRNKSASAPAANRRKIASSLPGALVGRVRGLKSQTTLSTSGFGLQDALLPAASAVPATTRSRLWPRREQARRQMLSDRPQLGNARASSCIRSSVPSALRAGGGHEKAPD